MVLSLSPRMGANWHILIQHVQHLQHLQHGPHPAWGRGSLHPSPSLSSAAWVGHREGHGGGRGRGGRGGEEGKGRLGRDRLRRVRATGSWVGGLACSRLRQISAVCRTCHRRPPDEDAGGSHARFGIGPSVDPPSRTGWETHLHHGWYSYASQSSPVRGAHLAFEKVLDESTAPRATS